MTQAREGEQWARWLPTARVVQVETRDEAGERIGARLAMTQEEFSTRPGSAPTFRYPFAWVKLS